MDLAALFARTEPQPPEASPAADAAASSTRLRRQRTPRGEAECLLDCFEPDRDDGAACASLRFPVGAAQRRALRVVGGYEVRSAAAGGWLLVAASADQDAYWIPQPPMLRRIDKDGHILSQRPAAMVGLEASFRGLAVQIEHPGDHLLDLVAWRLPAKAPDALAALQSLSALEQQRYFMWSSHTAYAQPADLYRHWVHGHLYENHEVWPRYWRVCSELDAFALYVTLTGLLRATGKALYDWMRHQVVFSVIDRQAGDGGWHHGEWTDAMESHYRLHAGAMHMLAAHFEETRDPAVAHALDKAAEFAASKIDRIDSGAWYLHDSLELGEGSLQKYPFRTLPSRALGKAPSNLLVLNTHLDTNIAMARHREVTGDERHGRLIASAHASTLAVLGLRPAEWLYRLLFRAIALSFLPTAKARTLPLPLRALKRIGWKYFIPWLPSIKRRWPRLVMPGGYIERELSMCMFSVRYQPVNLMDLARTRRRFDEGALDALLSEVFGFTHDCGLTARWKELRGKEDDSLGFWAEALYHLALARPDRTLRAWLAEAILDLEDNGLGLPPSMLGANAEAVAPSRQSPCPNPADVRLRVVNLSQGEAIEWLIVNPTRLKLGLNLRWKACAPPPFEPSWTGPAGEAVSFENGVHAIGPRSWLLGTGTGGLRQ
ncbi:MAG: hypothetical protein LC125_04595 [Burkholderiales bacterium]|nr:hypothetical protein [Burkholderiales bacterium]